MALAISSKSKIIQSIILEADSPYVEFKTQVQVLFYSTDLYIPYFLNRNAPGFTDYTNYYLFACIAMLVNVKWLM